MNEILNTVKAIMGGVMAPRKRAEPKKTVIKEITLKNSEDSEEKVAKKVAKIRDKKVLFRHLAPKAQVVTLAGSFNGWSITQTPMKRSVTGLWSVTLSLPPGQYEYRYFVDERWEDEQQPKQTTPNPYGGNNAIIVI